MSTVTILSRAVESAEGCGMRFKWTFTPTACAASTKSGPYVSHDDSLYTFPVEVMST